MTANSIKHELQCIISGKSPVGQGALIQTIAHHLRGGASASRLAETGQQNREEERAKLIRYASEHQLWVHGIDFSLFISAGAEQRVYIKDEKHVYKLNDAIYYATWLDYFHSLLFNNFFFPDTAYQLKGFYQENGLLYALVEQPYVKATHPTDLATVKAFMEYNGFQNTRNHDYYHPQLGVILEDLHDENVLTQDGILYFIDTVFFVKPAVFWL